MFFDDSVSPDDVSLFHAAVHGPHFLRLLSGAKSDYHNLLGTVLDMDMYRQMLPGRAKDPDSEAILVNDRRRC